MGSGKDRNIYLVNREAMGKFNPQGNQNIYQELPKALKGERFRGAPAILTGGCILDRSMSSMREFRFIDARLRAEPVSITAAQFGYPGAMPSVSGTVRATGSSGLQMASRRCYTPTMRTTWRMNCTTATKQLRGKRPLRCRKQVHHAHDRSGKVYVGTTDGVGVWSAAQSCEIRKSLTAKDTNVDACWW